MEDLLVLAPLVTAFCEAIKRLGLNSKYLPFVAMAVGLGLSFGFLWYPSVLERVVIGLAVGLSAVGLFESGKGLKRLLFDTEQEG